MTPHEVIERGRIAAALLDDVLLSEVVATAREREISEWIKCENPAERDGFWHRIHAIDTVPNELRKLVSRGSVESQKLDKP